MRPEFRSSTFAAILAQAGGGPKPERTPHRPSARESRFGATGPGTPMRGDIFIVQGDITQLAADAIVCTTSDRISGSGKMHSAFRENVAGFRERLDEIRQAP